MKDPQPVRASKYGVYQTERGDFDFAREGCVTFRRTAEAELMDWADDIAYSLHDLEDILRFGALPWERIFLDYERLVERALGAWPDPPSDARQRLQDAYRSLTELFSESASRLIGQPYEATREQRVQIRAINSALIGRYVRALRLTGAHEDHSSSSVSIAPREQDEMRILKQVTRDYVEQNRILAAQWKGQGCILRDLFEDLMDDIDDRRNSG